MNGFLVEKDAAHIKALAISWGISLLLLIISMCVSSLIFKKDAIACFASAFSNPGFFGIPLIVSAISPEAVFYVAPFIFCVNIFQWTYGTYKLVGASSRITLTRILKAPFFVALCIGMFLFFTQIKLPMIVERCLEAAINLNTPLAMFSIGIYMAGTKLVDLITNKSLYLIVLVRQLVIPLISFGLLSMIQGNELFELKLALLIVAACPVGSNVAVYAQLYDKDYSYAVKSVVVSTILAVLTVPAVVWLAITVW